MSRKHARMRTWLRENGMGLDGYAKPRSARQRRIDGMSPRRRDKLFRMVNKRFNTWVWQQIGMT